ncbi:MAG TPA: sulfotransferase domain-containing protein [Acidimicrobiia bacterium]|nr:sulfotransferase domain-containing protein [Acidimicrobiia bacterium]
MRYHSFLTDSARWGGFDFRPGDIIISTPAKCGTTWTQMICGLLIFQTPEFDRPLDLISPWLEMRTRRRDDVFAIYDAQTHRRFIKSHTPLDGLPVDERVTYLGVGRDPRDVALSMAAHLDNIDFGNFFGVMMAAADGGEMPPLPPPPPAFTGPRQAFLHWVDNPDPPEDVPMSLTSTVHHLAGFWDVRHRDDVVLLHYDDLQADLEGEMRRLAGRLAIDVPESRWPALVEAARFEEMRRRADVVAPDTESHLWKSNTGFFHRGTSGQWRDALDDEALARYETRLAELAPPDLAAWLHQGAALSA